MPIKLQKYSDVALACVAGLIILLAARFYQGLATPLYPGAFMLLWLCLGTPVLEEWVFRGFIQAEIGQKFPLQRNGISLANLLTSTAFAGLHLYQHINLWSALVFFPSLVFGYLRDRHQSPVPAMVVHIIYNSAYFALYGI